MALEHDEAAEKARSASGRGDAELRFRAMKQADLPQVMAIERRAYEFPWTDAIFRDCIRAGYYCCLLTGAGEVLGYGIMAVAADEAHVLNLCVDRNAQGQGLGRALLDHLIERARSMGAFRMLLEVRVSNATALSLYESAGFSEIGIRRNYYPGGNGREDAIVLSKVVRGGR